MFKERGTEGIEKVVLPALKDVAQEAREALLDKVYEHYMEFIEASREISELQKDMLELNEHLNNANLLLRSLNQVWLRLCVHNFSCLNLGAALLWA